VKLYGQQFGTSPEYFEDLHPFPSHSPIMTNQAAPVQEYWLPGYGLSRQVVVRQIQYFLGPSATIRPYCLQVDLRGT